MMKWRNIMLELFCDEVRKTVLELFYNEVTKNYVGVVLWRGDEKLWLLCYLWVPYLYNYLISHYYFCFIRCWLVYWQIHLSLHLQPLWHCHVPVPTGLFLLWATVCDRVASLHTVISLQGSGLAIVWRWLQTGGGRLHAWSENGHTDPYCFPAHKNIELDTRMNFACAVSQSSVQKLPNKCTCACMLWRTLCCLQVKHLERDQSLDQVSRNRHTNSCMLWGTMCLQVECLERDQSFDQVFRNRHTSSCML